MRQLKLFRWAAALTLAIALAPAAAFAQEADTVTISSTFYMDYLTGTVGPDLAEVYTNGHAHTWTLTLHGTTQTHKTYTTPFDCTAYDTEIHATSFDLEFFGPDAATLNGIVSDHIAGGDVLIYLSNRYSSGIGDDFAVMFVEPTGPDFSFASDCDVFGCGTLFPTDADGYPVVGPDPFSILAEVSYLIDNRPGNNGDIESLGSLVTFQRSVGAGDFNGDNVVDAADYVAWRKSPGIYTQNDYVAWRSHFGQTNGKGSSPGASDGHAAIPEPNTSWLTLLVTVLTISICRNRAGHEWRVNAMKQLKNTSATGKRDISSRRAAQI